MREEIVSRVPAMHSRPRIFTGEETPIDQRSLEIVGASLRDADLAAPPVLLPDFLHKSNMEMPSSMAVATLDTIRPTLSTPSLNCGMALIALDADLVTRDSMSGFFDLLRARFPWPARLRSELTTSEVLRAAAEGAPFAVDRFDVEPGILERIEQRGALDLERYGGVERLRREIPWLVRVLSRMRYGTIGPSNHFIEVQHVDEVYDHDTAARLGLKRGQVTVQYHGGGGVLAGQLGRLFVPRKKMRRIVRMEMSVLKPWHHLAKARSMEEMRLRKKLYFTPGHPIPRASDEGDRFLLVSSAAMNYGFGFRVATYAGILAAAKQAFGVGGRLVVDSPHDSIYEETIDGVSAVVHRQGASRSLPGGSDGDTGVFASAGSATLLPGTHRTSSYLTVPGERAVDALYSACHGSGVTIKDFERRGLSTADPRGRTTLRFGYDRAEPEPTPQLDDRGIDATLEILTRNRLSRPIARMRPLGVLH